MNKVLTPFLEIALSLRYISMAVFAAILILAAGTFAGGLIKFVFFPPIDGEEVTIDLTMPVGTPYDVTKQYAQEILRAVQEVRQEINAENGVVSMREAQRSSSAGTTGGEEKENRQQGEKPQGEERGGAARLRFPLGGASVQEDVYKATLFMVGRTITQANPVDSGGEASSNNRAQIRIKLAESDKRNVTSLDIERRVREKIGAIPGADELTFESSLIQAGPDVTVELSHPDPDILVGAADRLKKDLSSSPGVVEVTSSLKPGKREYLFRLKPAGLAAGLTPAGLGRQLRNSFYGNEVQRINRDGSELKVMVRYPELQREKLKTIHKMRVDLPDGSKAPLSAVAEIIQQKGFSTIQRADGQRIARLTADVDKAVVTPNETISLVFNQLVPVLQEEFPSLTASLEGESKDRQEDLAIMGRNMIISLMLIFVLLGTLLKSYVQPIIILAIIPFGMIGAVIGHVLLGYTLSFISTFGIVALTGVIVNNSVVMIDYYNTRLREGAGFDAAIIEAVQRRFRPILLTTLTTSMGLLPILIEDSLQARFLIPMAISLAFGLIFGTLILLILLPVLIAVVEDLRRIPARIISYVRLETGYSSGHKS